MNHPTIDTSIPSTNIVDRESWNKPSISIRELEQQLEVLQERYWIAIRSNYTPTNLSMYGNSIAELSSIITQRYMVEHNNDK